MVGFVFVQSGSNGNSPAYYVSGGCRLRYGERIGALCALESIAPTFIAPSFSLYSPWYLFTTGFSSQFCLSSLVLTWNTLQNRARAAVYSSLLPRPLFLFHPPLPIACLTILRVFNGNNDRRMVVSPLSRLSREYPSRSKLIFQRSTAWRLGATLT